MLGDFRTEDERDIAPRRHRRKDSGKSLIAMTLVVALFGVLGVGGWWAYENVIKEHFIAEDFTGAGNGTEVVVTVEEGWTVADIANELEAQGVVASARAFLNASEDDGNSGQGIQPGTYEMQAEMSAASALAFLLDAANRMTNAVTIPEGYRIFEVFTKLSEHTGVPVADFEAAAADPEALGVDPLWFEGFGDRQVKSVEGFLFPATYEFDDEMTAAQMLSEMIAKFNATIEEIGFLEDIQNIQDPDPDFDPSALTEQTFNPPTNGEFEIYPWMALQIASIVQSESGIPEDDARIARVMYNKLYLSWIEHGQTNCNCFESEAIWNYGRLYNGEEAITSHADIDWFSVMRDPDNPWAASAPENAGYMPTPISNPGAAVLEAAANPVDGDWLFFVTAYEDGSALFAHDYDDHEDNTEIAQANGMA
ncbi:endolytic transglycosylase MltG [Glycomyces sp. TRM65418]|uniref:endolytic transglycosylase MltG n=1 Tax=Glycomyces sp. TRM65418 TaxID=2867006 RepID=UPI001CE4D8A7|nr:endolytic transglycosylase MltG [Glycomyces sp. TRM65418]MCC3764305.1 endolytic transglycosylase MltG [Glycomyces sp. TRM65418]QZD53986.1 endolytic transglycosylase MltG [Glycomyces sp. TRM65418]